MSGFGPDPWGSHRAWFALPGRGVCFTGLDAEQLSALRRAYPAFVSETIDCAEDGWGLECHARRIEGTPRAPLAEFSQHGQYVPRAIHCAEGIDLTAFDFRARFPLSDLRKPGWLGVVNGEDLVQPNVIENFLRVFAAYQALSARGIVLHSAGLVIDDRAYLFAGRSGAGKTTLTRKGHQAGAGVLSDDVNLVLPGAGGYEAHAVPFTGEFGRTLAQVGGLAAYPVAGLVLLERGERLDVEPIRPSAAVARLLVASPFVNTESAVAESLLEVLSTLVARLPVIALRCRREDGFDEIMAAVNAGFADERAV